VALLDKLGLGQAARAAGGFNGVAGAPLPAPVTPAAAAQAAPQAPAQTSRPSGIWWGLGGLATGLLLCAIWVRRRRSHADTATAQADDSAPAPRAVVADEVS
jgi:hypothetical protein